MIDPVIQTIITQATILRSTNYAVENCDRFLYFFGISFKNNKISKVITMYDKALTMLNVTQESSQEVLLYAAQWTHESASLTEYIKKYADAAQKYIAAATYYYYCGYKSHMKDMKMQAFAISDLCNSKQKRIIRIECYYLDAIDKYDSGYYNDATAYLLDAIKETCFISELANSNKFVKLYEKLVYIYLIHLNLPNTAMNYCDEIIRRSIVHADYYGELKNKLVKQDYDGANSMLLQLKK